MKRRRNTNIKIRKRRRDGSFILNQLERKMHEERCINKCQDRSRRVTKRQNGYACNS